MCKLLKKSYMLSIDYLSAKKYSLPKKEKLKIIVVRARFLGPRNTLQKHLPKPVQSIHLAGLILEILKMPLTTNQTKHMMLQIMYLEVRKFK